MAVRRWNVSTRKRYYVEGVTGWPIRPGTELRTHGSPTTTWSVFDAHNIHHEVARFEPKGGRTSGICKLYADELCAELNAEDSNPASRPGG